MPFEVNSSFASLVKNMSLQRKTLLCEFSSFEHKEEQEAACTLICALVSLSDGEIATGSHFKTYHPTPQHLIFFLCTCTCVGLSVNVSRLEGIRGFFFLC